MSKSAAVSLTVPSPSSASPGVRPPTGLTNSAPLSSASHPFRPDPYDVSHHSSEGPIPRSLNSSITPTITATARRRDLRVGDHPHGVALFASLRHLHLVSLPLVTAVGRLRVVRRPHRVRPHLPGSFSTTGTFFSCASSSSAPGRPSLWRPTWRRSCKSLKGTLFVSTGHRTTPHILLPEINAWVRKFAALRPPHPAGLRTACRHAKSQPPGASPPATQATKRKSTSSC